MKLRFWGTRGSIATPGAGTTDFGGNTSCVEIVADSGKRFIIDCGTGARPLGAHLMAHAPKPIAACILLSHTHWDHIQGFPFFAPVFAPGNKFTVWGPEGCNKTLPEVLAGQMEFTYFPVQLSDLGSEIEYFDMAEGTRDIDGVRISSQYLNHPAAALGYRIEADGVAVEYLCDHEPYSTTLWRADAEPGSIHSILHDGDRLHAAFMQNADVVIHDAQYTPEEYESKKNWGHSTYEYVVRLALAAGVKKVFLTHHDPSHDDAFLRGIEERAQAIVAASGRRMEVRCAREGYEEIVERRAGEPQHLTETREAAPAECCRLRILVADDDREVRLLARNALSERGHTITEACRGEEALEAILANPPDLVLLALGMPGMNGLEVLRSLRARKETEALPVLILTTRSDEASTRMSFDSGATDYLNKPFSAPQLDARIRMCVSRTAETA